MLDGATIIIQNNNTFRRFFLTLYFCISSGGETIKNINQQSGAHVELQRNPPPNTDPNVRVFSIRGSPQQMEMARQLIDEKIGVSDRHK